MAKNLLIVESPAKARTLARYLGRNFQVKASVGHIMDLPKSRLGVDVERDFKAEFQVIHGKGKIIEDIRRAARDKEHIYLAPDPDREGEAIAWHIASKLGRRRNVHRVLINEITKRAVLDAIRNPRPLDRDRFEAQLARRILDRLVGYQLSPLLWRKVRRGLSAGRVQSVAVRIVCEREQAIEAFVPEEYWTVTARLEGSTPPPFAARLAEIAGQRLDHKKLRLDSRERTDEVLARLSGVEWEVTKVERRERRQRPAPPFITSKLQQEASRKLGFSPARTMRIAQRLYEGVELGPEGAVGLITYMRTDSTRLSAEAVGAVREYIAARYGKDYVPESPNIYRSRRGAQDAHEAIRPTSMNYEPERVAKYLSREELALYALIWNRFVASQMEAALFEQTSVDIRADDCRFRATGRVMKFDGFIRLYTEGKDEETNGRAEEEEEGAEGVLPPLAEGDRLRLLELLPEQHFTQPPPRFTQATLIKELEERGIGRPSTYAAIMSTILDKEYVREDEQRRLRPTELGRLVTELLVASFPDILDVEFTAGMEDQLDRVEEGQQRYLDVLRRFYERFARDLERAETEMRDVKREEIPTDVRCDRCGEPMVIRWGRRGEFLACRRYPECRNARNFTREENGAIKVVREELTDIVCEKCGRPMQVRFSRYGKFLGCSGYPGCDNVRRLHRPSRTGVRCPSCGQGEIVERRSRRGHTFFGCERYPACTFASWERPVPLSCPRCAAPYLLERTTKRDGRVRRCAREGCEFRESVEESAGAHS